jgi:hypothetical protein
MFDKAVEWVRANVAEGVDVEEFVKMLPRPADLIKSDPDFKSEFDRQVSYAVDNHDKRFQDEKLPTILEQEREKLRKELNPEETAEQKRIRELEERIAKADQESRKRELRDSLRKKATELGVTDIGLQPDDMEPFVAFGDEAPQVLESFLTRTREAFTSNLDAKLKEKFNAGPEPDEAQSQQENKSFDEIMSSTWLGKQ